MNAAAAERTIEAMRSAGLLESSDDALVAAVLSMASYIDNADEVHAAHWEAYGKMLDRLRSLTDGGSDAFEAAMAGLFAAARDAQNRGQAESAS